MKKIFTILTVALLTATMWAQSPEKMSYQSVIRDADDNLITEQNVGMQISILQGSSGGTAVYEETQMPTTNINGLVSLEIGAGTVVSGDFAAIDWANGPYFIKTQTDPTGGTNYNITGTSQLLSSPYALHAKSADSLTGTLNELDPRVPEGTQAGEMQYWNGTEWVIVAAGNEGAILTFINNTPTWVEQISVSTVENPTTGEIWMDRNLGAAQVATMSADPDSYGDLYQWGRGSDGHEKRTSSTTSTLSDSDSPGHGDFILNFQGDWRSPQNDDLWQGESGTNNPCPSGFRLPTEAEWNAERASWSSSNAAGAFASPLKLPAGGQRLDADGSLENVGSLGNYWTSTIDGTNSLVCGFLSFYSYVGANYRASGNSVRCIKD